MPLYSGRTSQMVQTHNFGGINTRASLMNIGDNEAASIQNWDIGTDGAITKRSGLLLMNTFSTPMLHMARYMSLLGVEYYGVFADAKFWECTTINGTFTDQTNGITITNTTNPFVSANWKGKLIVANGVDPAIYIDPTAGAQTLKAASLITPPQPPTVRASDVGTRLSGYVITAVTPQGESTSSGVGYVTLGPSSDAAADPFSATHYNIVTWVPPVGCTSQKVYWMTNAGDATGRIVGGSFNVFYQVAEVGPTVSTFYDNVHLLPYGLTNPPMVNNAYCTPLDWDTNGAPEGFAVIARGRDERLLAWRGSTVWASALGDPLQWVTINDSFIFPIQDGTDSRQGGVGPKITAIGSLFDLTGIFTAGQANFYTGASQSDITLFKTVPVGCVSPNSILPVGDDLYFWSQYGPTNMKRVLSGQDVQSTDKFNERVQPLIFGTATEYWNKICVYNSPPDGRIVWAVPGSGQTTNSVCFVYQYDVDAWTQYTGWSPVSVVRDANFNLYGAFTDGKVYQMHSGTTDNFNVFTAIYKTGWMDARTWGTRKRVIRTDVITDKQALPLGYTFDVGFSYDYGKYTGAGLTCTDTTTDGSTIESLSSASCTHQCYMNGVGNSIQLTFTSADERGCRIMGWRPDYRLKGIRG